jgi:hypothetical protein
LEDLAGLHRGKRNKRRRVSARAFVRLVSDMNSY